MTSNEAAYDMVTSFYNRMNEMSAMCNSYSETLGDKHANLRGLLNIYLNEIENWKVELRLMQSILQDYRWRP